MSSNTAIVDLDNPMDSIPWLAKSSVPVREYMISMAGRARPMDDPKIKDRYLRPETLASSSW
jgi:hypothetical protein